MDNGQERVIVRWETKKETVALREDGRLNKDYGSWIGRNAWMQDIFKEKGCDQKGIRLEPMLSHTKFTLLSIFSC